MNRRLLLSLLIAISCIFVLASCNNHKYNSEWSTDENSHWHQCTECDDKKDLGNHTWDAGLDGTEGKVYTCTTCGYKKTDKNFLGSINGKNNDEVKLTGVVFGKVSDGFYLSDGETGAFVKLSSANASKLATLVIGDEVEVSGKLSVTTSQVFVKNADVTLKKAGQDALEPTAKTLGDINALNASNHAVFGMFFRVTVALSKNQAGRLVLSDDSGSIVVEPTQAAKFESLVGKKASLNICLLSYDTASSSWTCVAFEEGAKEEFINIDDVKEAIFAKVSIPEQVDKSLKLVTSYNLEPSVVFSWKVLSGNGLTIENNVVTIDTTLTQDSEVKLELKITSGTTSATKEYTTTVIAPKAVSLKDALATKDTLLKVSGLVVARGIADETSSYHYIIIMDEDTFDLLSLSVSANTCKSINVGDKIEAFGKVTAMGELFPDYYSLSQIIAINTLSTGNTVDYSKYNAATLNTVEDYQDAIDNHHNEIKLYKVVSPNMIGSGSTSYSWNQFGPTKEAAKSGLVNTRQFCLLIANCEFNGLTDWISTYNVPKKNEGAKLYAGTVMYVYSVFQTGDTKWAFILPSNDACYFDAEIAVSDELNNTMETELAAVEAGVYTLPAKVTINEVDYALTWSSSDDNIINGATGAYEKQYEATTVVLTASFKVGEKDCQVAITVNVSAAEVLTLSVSQAIAQGEGTVYKLEAYVAAIGGSTDNVAEYRNGLVLTDGTKVIYYSTAEYKVGETDIQIGDKLLIKKALITVTADDVKISEGTVEILSSGNTIDYSALEATTISSEEEMVAFMGAHGKTSGLVVKFVGPFYFVGTGSTSKNARYQINYVGAASSAAARYLNSDITSEKKSDGRTVSFSVPATALLLGANWYEGCGLPEKSGSKSFEVLGEFYAVSCAGGNTMQAWTIINADKCKLEAPSAEYLIKKQLNNLFTTTEISAGSAGVLALPEKVTVGGVDYPIAWTSSDVNVISNSGDYSKVTEEKKATLTATFTTDSEKTWSLEFTLLPKEIEYMTVSQVKASESNNIEAFQGIVVGVASGNSGTIDKGPSTALYVSDGTTVMAIDTFAGELSMTKYTPKAGETDLAVGDIIKVQNVTKSGNAIVCASGTTAFVDGKKTGSDWFNPTVATTLLSDDDVETYAKTFTKTAIKEADNDKFEVVKFTGTAENPLYICAVNGYFLNVFYKDTTQTSEDDAKYSSITPGYTPNKGKIAYLGGHIASLHYAMGETWLLANTPVATVGGATSGTSWATVQKPSATVSLYNWGYTGTIYMIFSYSGSADYPYLYHGFLGAGCTLSLISK